VLGKEAQDNGLAKSLLQRLHDHYERLGKDHGQTTNHLTGLLLHYIRTYIYQVTD